MSGEKIVRALLTVVVGVLLCALVGCSSVAPLPTVSGSAPEQAPVRHPAGDGDFLPRDLFNDRTFGAVTTETLRQDYGLLVTLPDVIAGGKYEGLYVPEDRLADPSRGFMAVYSNDAVIEVTRFESAEAATQYLLRYGVDVELFGDYVKQRRVDGRTLYSRPVMDVPPVLDDAGRVQPGTGFRTVAATVAWTEGVFVMQCLSRDVPIDDLVFAAGAVTVADSTAPSK